MPIIDVSTPILDIKLNQKASFAMRIQIKDGLDVPVNISAWGFSASIKAAFKDTIPVTNFAVAQESGSWVAMSLLPSQTALLTKQSYHYDLVALNVSPNPDETYRLFQGTIEVSPGVTGPVGP